MSWSGLYASFEYLCCGFTTIINILLFHRGGGMTLVVKIWRQFWRLKSGIFWRLKSIPEQKGLRVQWHKSPQGPGLSTTINLVPPSELSDPCQQWLTSLYCDTWCWPLTIRSEVIHHNSPNRRLKYTVAWWWDMILRVGPALIQRCANICQVSRTEDERTYCSTDPGWPMWGHTLTRPDLHGGIHLFMW